MDNNYKGEFYVGDKFRTNAESLVAGGYDVKIILSDGSSKVYTRVKNPTKYFGAAKRNNPNVVNFEVLKESE
jgi:hypothetical protein